MKMKTKQKPKKPIPKSHFSNQSGSEQNSDDDDLPDDFDRHAMNPEDRKKFQENLMNSSKHDHKSGAFKIIRK